MLQSLCTQFALLLYTVLVYMGEPAGSLRQFLRSPEYCVMGLLVLFVTVVLGSYARCDQRR